MATPRHLLVDPENECDYHLVSRCVRRAFLCGVDEYTGRDCSHRRTWLVERLRQLAPCFAVDVYAFTVLPRRIDVPGGPKRPRRVGRTRVCPLFLVFFQSDNFG